jgi:hypothetical protein
MRSVERSLSGGLPFKTSLFSRSLKTSKWEEYMNGIVEAKLDNVSEARMDFARSGVVAFGKYESGQPSHSGMSVIALISAEQERCVGG